jgi:hypothetical protein
MLYAIKCQKKKRTLLSPVFALICRDFCRSERNLPHCVNSTLLQPTSNIFSLTDSTGLRASSCVRPGSIGGMKWWECALTDAFKGRKVLALLGY